MPRVFRQTYSAPIPDGAEPITVKGKNGKERPAVRFPGPSGKPVVAPLTRDGTRCLLPSPTGTAGCPTRTPRPAAAGRSSAPTRPPRR
jgi:hypothetical protein